jgi:RNA polymerase sigma-70 factor (ECF subfamily)
MSQESGYAGFPPTLWTQILRAREGAEATRRDALDKLLASYWRPLYAAIRYGWNRSREEARDLTQDLLADLLERRFWEQIEPSRGRFRSFLKAALKNFMMNAVRDAGRHKRSAPRAAAPIEDLEIPDYAGRPPEEVLDQEWIATVLARAVDRLREEYGEEKRAWFEALRRYDLEDGRPTYGSIAADLGVTESDVRNYLHAARSRLRAIVRELVLEYSSDEGDLHEELRRILG